MKSYFKILLLAVSIFYFQISLADDMKSFDINVDGESRSYLIYTPQGVPKGRMPLMIFLHGGFGSAQIAADAIGLNEVAKQNHFLVAYPNGISTRFARKHRVWNAGRCCGIAKDKNINDVHFIDVMIKEILQKYAVDPKRVYLSGMSNGAMMAYRLLCELPEPFAAIVAVSGTLAIESCTKGQDVALYHIHGTADSHVPFNGGTGKRSGKEAHRSVSDTLDIVTKLRHCGQPTTKTFPNGDVETNYSCKAGAPVKLRTIKNGEHEWPGRSKAKSQSLFSASEAAWNFVKDFSRK